MEFSLIRLHQELMNLFNLFNQQHYRNAVRQNNAKPAALKSPPPQKKKKKKRRPKKKRERERRKEEDVGKKN